jgi:predicted AAA+ superfamily ATPase
MVLLERITKALERILPAVPPVLNLDVADAFVWQAESMHLEPVAAVNHIPLELLCGIDDQRNVLLNNTRQFVAGSLANNALLWGARGMGKSALVKAIHAAINSTQQHTLALVEITREDIGSLPRLLRILRTTSRRCILFCDDLSFSFEDRNYKSLKTVLEGGIEGRPPNVLFYATSNCRHLILNNLSDKKQLETVVSNEEIEERISLSDRFGLWLGFHTCSQEGYFSIVERYAAALQLELDNQRLRVLAHEWAISRGARSGRVAWQFIQDLAGKQVHNPRGIVLSGEALTYNRWSSETTPT